MTDNKLENSYGTGSHPFFGFSSSISKGDPYEKKAKVSHKDRKDDPKHWERHKGKQFSTNPLKSGKQYRGFKSLYEGEKYVDPHAHERAYQKKQKKKIVGGSFKPSSPSKMNSGIGSYFGTIGAKYSHLPEYNVVKHGSVTKKRDITEVRRPILTSPSKKGGYGYINTTIGKPFERPKLQDDYDASNKLRKAERAIHKKKMKGKAFLAGKTHKNEYFNSNPFRAPDPSKVPKASKKKIEKKKKFEKSFKPSSPSKLGGTIGKYPEYISDPYVKRVATRKKDKEETKVWRAVSGYKSGYQRSVIFGNKL